MVISTMRKNKGNKMATRGKMGQNLRWGIRETCLGRPHLSPVTCLPSSPTMRRFCEAREIQCPYNWRFGADIRNTQAQDRRVVK